MEVFTRNRERIVLEDTALSSGGEGEVRLITSGLPKYRKSCVKIYYQKKRTPELESRIKFMADNPPQMIAGNGFMLGWPQEAVYDNTYNFVGFIMPLAFPDSKQLVNLTTPKVSAKLGQEWHNKYSQDPSCSVEQRKYALLSRLKLLHNIAIPVHLLHSTGKYVLKDFKPQNVLVTHDGRVTIVDMDSIQIMDHGKLLFPGTAATDLYIPTEFHTNGVGRNPNVPLDKSWDYFALGVVFYQILFGLHPYVVTPVHQKDEDSNEISYNISSDLFPFGSNKHRIKSYPPLHNKFSALPPSVQSLFVRCFSDNPSARPSAEEWGKEIHNIIQAVGNLPTPPPVTPTPKKPAPTPQPPVPYTPVPQKPEPQHHPHPHSSSNMVVCPECGCLSDSIKRYELPHIWVFLGVYLYYQNIEYTCCPNCMRNHILVKGFTYNILTANLVWLAILLPWSIIQFIRSFTDGHSDDVKRELGM